MVIEETVANKKISILHRIFSIGIIAKCVDGILEIIGGALLLFFDPTKIHQLLVLITQHELLTDSNDVIANYILNLGNNLSTSAQHFAAIYLFTHGLLKIIIYILLLKGNKKTYIFIITTLIMFITYQIYRFIIGGSIFMLFVTIFDILILVLTVIEYNNKKEPVLSND